MTLAMSSEATDKLTMASADQALAILLPLLILLSSLLFLLLVFLLFLIIARRRKGIALPEEEGPLDLAREEELEVEGGLDGIEQRWLDSVDESTRTGYIRAKRWQSQFPPNSQPTDITLTQFLAIQEKGVSAWCFEPDFDSISPPFLVTSRTEILFLADGIGMSTSEGGGACVQCNLPLPKVNEVYYWEAKLFEKPESTTVAIGLATKPYPSFRLPGWNRYSVGYFSSDGFKSHNHPFSASSYGPPLLEGDVIGLGYRPRTGTVFFTRNGKKLEDAYIGLNRHNLFPTVGANGAANIHVNLGQAGFVFIEANVKKWGLAPSSGTLAPPPAYGLERGSILLETADGTTRGLRMTMPNAPGRRRSLTQQTPRRRRSQRNHDQPESSRASHDEFEAQSGEEADDNASLTDVRSPVHSGDEQQETLADVLETASDDDHFVYQPHSSSRPLPPRRSNSESSLENFPHNPPTPNVMDISLHSLQNVSPFAARLELEERQQLLNRYDQPPPTPIDENPPESSTSSRRRSRRKQAKVTLPPAYNMVDPNVYAPGVAEAMLGESYAAFQAAQAGHYPQSLPTGSIYEGRTSTVEASSSNSAEPSNAGFGWFRSFRRPRVAENV